MAIKRTLQQLLLQHRQEKLLSYLESLGDVAQQRLCARIESLDFSIFDSLWSLPDTHSDLSPMPALQCDEIARQKAQFDAIGLQALKDGKVGALLLAGGQGTRLGADGPKGAVNIGINRPYYIFQALFETMCRRADEVGRPFPVYIMTGEQNHRQTVTFLQSHRFFGYPAKHVYFFKQEMTPATDFNGDLLLSAPDELAMSPNGNGGWFTSFVHAGLEKKAVAQGVEWLNVFAVDNVLQQIADPTFIGATLQKGYACGAKVIDKADPLERIGVLCESAGHPYIVEYYEMSEELQHKTDANGNLLFRYGVILNYLFSLDALRALPASMPIHRVEKKVPYYDPEKGYVTPTAPNAHKYETLVLDMIAKMPDCLAYEVKRMQEFAPIKNPTGVDSVESARVLLQKNGILL